MPTGLCDACGSNETLGTYFCLLCQRLVWQSLAHTPGVVCRTLAQCVSFTCVNNGGSYCKHTQPHYSLHLDMFACVSASMQCNSVLIYMHLLVVFPTSVLVGCVCQVRRVPFFHCVYVSLSFLSVCLCHSISISLSLSLFLTLHPSPSESYSFVLTSMEGNRRFGYCRRLLVRYMLDKPQLCWLECSIPGKKSREMFVDAIQK